MSTTNPPKSSGSSLEQAGRKQQNLPLLVAVFLLLHAVVLGGILWVGCKPHKEDMAKNEAPPPSPIGGLPPIGGTTNSPFFEPLDNSQSPAAPGPTSSGPPAGPVGPPPAPTGITSGPIPPPSVTSAPTLNPSAIPTTTPSSSPSTEAVMPLPDPPPPPPPPAPGTSREVGPAPRPAAPRPATASGRIHVVGRGDTYYSIAREYKTTMNAIKEVNPGVDPTKLQLGQKIKVPAPASSSAARPRPTGSTHVVKSGDTLGRIARKHKTTVDKLRALNGLTSDRILVGQVLRLPSN